MAGNDTSESTVKIPEDGIYENIPVEEYRAWPLCHHSAVKIMTSGGTPAHYKAALNTPGKDTKAKTFGTWAHIGLLEPERLDAMQPLPENVPRRSGPDWKALQADNPDVTFFPAGEWKEIEGHIAAARIIREHALAHPIAASLIERSKREVSFVTTCPVTGMRYKGRIDLFGDNFIGDPKTTIRMYPYDMARASYQFGYDIQAAMYSDAISRFRGLDPEYEPVPFWFIMIEKTPPYLVTIFDGLAAFDESSEKSDPLGYIKHGREKYVNALRDIKACEESGRWHGQTAATVKMVIPRYAGQSVYGGSSSMPF